MRTLIAGNWKMNALGGAGALALARTVREGAAEIFCDLLVCPAYPQLVPVASVLAGSAVALGAQDCHPEAEGPFTGDVSALMLAEAGASYVILGHSERRLGHGESDELVRAKVAAAAAAGLTPIVCVGETEAERLAGRAEEVVGHQLSASFGADFAGVIAYEPVWAIGSGRTPSSTDVAAIHGFIRRMLLDRLGARGAGLRLLYGGSVKPQNAAELLALSEVNGALVGGASLKAADFLAIARAVLRA